MGRICGGFDWTEGRKSMKRDREEGETNNSKDI